MLSADGYYLSERDIVFLHLFSKDCSGDAIYFI